MPKYTRHSLFRLFLWIPKLRRWHDKMHSPGRMLGAPAGEQKLWSQFKQQIASVVPLVMRPLTRRYRKNAWVEFRTIGVRWRVRTIKPVKPARKFIITLVNLPRSVQVAERCIESAKRHGEQDEPEIFPATDKFEAHDFFVRHGLTWYHLDYNAELNKDPLPEMGCFASHYRLWQRCVELKEPIIVLEHDAVFRSAIPPLRFRHVILLSRPSFQIDKINIETVRTPAPGEIFYPMRRLAAAHCYAITPDAAHILINEAHRRLTKPADDFIDKDKLDILYYHPYPVDFDFEFSTIDQRQDSGPTPEDVWKSYTAGP